MIDVQNRIPETGQAGRVTLTQESGDPITGIMSMADGATEQGTPWNRQTARLLQADIRTYTIGAGQNIQAGDVVNIESSGGSDQIVIQDNAKDAIALQSGSSGQSIEVVFDGTVAVDWATEGQKIISNGVVAISPEDGMLSVYSNWRPGGIIVSGAYVGTGTYDVVRPNSLEFGFRPKVLIIQEEAETSCRSVVVLGDCAYSYMRSAGNANGSTIAWTWSDTGVSWYAVGGLADDQLNEDGVTYRYVAIG